MPDPWLTISRQPIRSGNEVSRNVMAVAAVIGAASGASNSQTSRSVDRPPAPGGNDSPAEVRVSDARAPATSRASAGWSDAQPARRPAAISSSLSSPSPSVSYWRRAWKAGISAWSMTTSSRTRSGSTLIPAWWLMVKLPSGCALAIPGSATAAIQAKARPASSRRLMAVATGYRERASGPAPPPATLGT